MKLKEEEIVSEKSGDFKGNNFGINADNMHMVIQAFQKSIYSNPIGSIVREIASNCADSHIEAGVTIPFEIEHVQKNSLTGSFEAIIFRDFGMGISPDRMENVFCNYFSSTKRADNTANGGWGVGCKAPFSYANTFYVKTRYDGLEYDYIAYKQQEGDRIDRVTEPVITSLHNGTEIVIPIKDNVDADKFIEEIHKQLLYFTNINYINITVNKSEIKFENKYCLITNQTRYNHAHAVIGTVSYPLDFDVIGIEQLYVPVAYKFAIGELSLPINREAIQYDDETKELIINRIKEASEAAKLIVDEEMKKETNFFKYIYKYTEISNKIGRYSRDNSASVVSILATISHYVTEGVISFGGITDMDIGKFNKTFAGFSFNYYSSSNSIINKNGFRVLSGAALSGVGKFNLPVYFSNDNLSSKKNRYLSSINPEGYIIIKDTGTESINKLAYWYSTEEALLIDDYHSKMLELIKNNSNDYESIDVKDGSDYEDVKEVNTALDIEAIRLRDEKIVTKQLGFVSTAYNLSDRFCFNLKDYKYKDLEDFDDLVIYGFQEDNDNLKYIGQLLSCYKQYIKYNSFDDSRIKILKIARKNEKHLTKHIYINDLIMHKHPILTELYTTILIGKEIDNLQFMQNFSIFNPVISEKYIKIKDYYDSHTVNTYSKSVEFFQELEAACKQLGLIDQNIISDLNILVEYSKGLSIFNNIDLLTSRRNSIEIDKINEIVAYLDFNNKSHICNKDKLPENQLTIEYSEEL